MNRRQEERVANLGRAFQEAVSDIVNLGEEDLRGCETEQSPVPEEVMCESPYPALAQYSITTQQVHNGFIVSVGCQTFVFEKFETASKYMAMYFQDPTGAEKKHRNGTLFN
jgi:hypothetical protein